jgi:flavin-dependent dehydrogenase
VKLSNNAKIGIIGGGPAGSMAGFFLLEMAQRVDWDLSVDIYEPRDFDRYGPPGCNMCAGVVSENLVQTLAAEGIDLPPQVVQRGIDSYILHTSGLPTVAINTPSDDLRIATVYRGAGPRVPAGDSSWESFDDYLLDLAKKRGVNVIHKRVDDISWEQDFPQVICKKTEAKTYDLLIGAVGVNAPILKKFTSLGFSYEKPPVKKGFVSEIYLGESVVQEYLGSSMHIFLLDIPGLKFAAIIPKVEYVTISLMGDGINKTLVEEFMNSAEVRNCLPDSLNWHFKEKEVDIGQACFCMPTPNVGPAIKPYGDRIVMIGDCAVSRLYKDGIGAAYITAKASVVTALFFGVSSDDFKDQYAPVCQRIARDNIIGNVIFLITMLYQKFKFFSNGMVRMVTSEQTQPNKERRMSRVLWDTFTGSATYREIFFKSIHPQFIVSLVSSTVWAFFLRILKRDKIE